MVRSEQMRYVWIQNHELQVVLTCRLHIKACISYKSVGVLKPFSGLCEICVFCSSHFQQFLIFSTNLKIMVSRSILVRGKAFRLKNEAWGFETPSVLCQICGFYPSHFK